MTRPFKLVGNWKMNKTTREALAFVKALPPLLAPNYLAVPSTCLKTLSLLDIPMLQIGAQNHYPEPEGAYTGELSASMVREAGAQFVLCGHSERRLLFNESNALINKKVHSALRYKMDPIVCLGESALERDQEETHAVLKKQLLESLAEVESSSFSQISIAYEPLWAIGTGTPATAEAAQEIHFQLRQILTEKWGPKEAAATHLLYGGSVTPDHLEELIKQPDIDGVLVGGASLKIEPYMEMIKLAGGLLK